MKFKVVKVNGQDVGKWELVEDKIDKSFIKGGKGNEEEIKKNRCSTRMASTDILNSKLKNEEL